MNHQELDVQTWAEQNFGTCALGDRRRTRRAVQAAAAMAAQPDASTPDQCETWGDLKAAYRLFHRPEVTYASLAAPHFAQTREQAAGHVLVVCDTTQIDVRGRAVQGASPIGDGRGRGFLLHSGLMVVPGVRLVLGLAGGVIHHRKSRRPGETFRQRLARPDRESRVWGEVIRQVGPPAAGVRYTYVLDRGADNFDVFCHLVQQGSDWVIRAAQLPRRIVTPEGASMSLNAYVRTLPLAGTYRLQVAANGEQTARTAEVEVRCGALTLPRPRDCSAFARDAGLEAIPMYVVEVREVSPPPGQKPLRWVLLTSHAARDFEEAWDVIDWYETRPVVEEFHKGLKTGCRLEQRRYETCASLEAVCGLLSVVAVRLLQVRSLAQSDPQRPAAEVVPRRYIAMLEAVRGLTIITVRDFYRALAGLGGFLGR